ncbi:putative Receptor-like kinase [Quillaja saponaria]|uniref:Receptor-like kinase n=1 Tax=Quillaja saponaria TaxID=32244 RepID=A0AAD7PY61_QUISA|nr:putative Receptor-like kinase [Quillaja saponaria]
MTAGKFIFLIWVSLNLCLMCVSLGFVPDDSILIDCGSLKSTRVGDRVFVADNSTSYMFTTSEIILAKTNSTSIPSSIDSILYHTARIFNTSSDYKFPIKRQGRHWIRLYFFPFNHENYNMSHAKFSVSAQNITLLKDFQIESGYLLREYSLNITSNNLVLTFLPSSDSFAFINAIEFFSLPEELIPESARSISSQGHNQSLRNQALETVARVNMGNEIVSPQNDTLWRLWVSDFNYLKDKNLAKFESNVKAVNFTRRGPTENIAPALVYGTLTRLHSEVDSKFIANMTWHFDVDPGFEYLVRFHFCDILNLSPGSLVFNVYINSWLVSRLDLGILTSNILGAPYFMDAITKTTDNGKLNISLGTSNIGENPSPDAILNGLEIMKISNSKNSLVWDSKTTSKMKVGIIVGLVTGVVVVILAIAVIVFLLCRKRKHVVHTKAEEAFAVCEMENKYSKETAIFSKSKLGYSFPLVVLQEATDNFSENLVIGIGGFGKVYKGALRDGTKVAVKRGASESQQGLAEFRTEIEMLTQFRHRHLLSLIGYCNEQNERIIIYEYMENGTLKNHLYGHDLPCLRWRQRLEICIGSARGLHYLHTGSAKAIIHRDVKSANILLDENFMAKVADFGLSKTGPEIDETHISTAVKGSFGYLDPEYLLTQQLTEKSDVYSFGVVMFEVICGRPVIDPSLPREKVNLVEWVMKCNQQGLIEEILDPPLVGQIKPDSLQKFVEIAEKCLAERGTYRPTMGDVLWNLEYALQIQEYNKVSVSDLVGVSMSKVFAQMVREDMR